MKIRYLLAILIFYIVGSVPAKTAGSSNKILSSAIAEATILSDPGGVGPPTANAASNIASTSFTANWGSVSGATEYLLEVSIADNFPTYVSYTISAPTTSYIVTGRNSLTNYFYRVKVKNESVYSNIVSVTTSVAAPIIGAATSVTTSSFTANWGSVSGATAYYVYVSLYENFSSFVQPFAGYSTSLLSQNIPGLAANTTYYYRVRGTKAPDYNPSDYSSTQTVTTLQPVPIAPTANTASNIASTSFTANWGSVSGATEYLLDVSYLSDFTTSFISNLSLTTTSFTVTDRNSGTPYYYRVRAKNGTGASTYSNAITVTTSVAAPIIGAAASVTTSSFTANWGSVSGATAYYLDVSSNVNFASFVDPFHNYSTNLLSTNISGLNANTTYYYRVRGTKAPDYNPSDYSSTQTVTTLQPVPIAPTANTASNIASTSFTANWGSVSGATEYLLDVSYLSDFTTSFISNLSLTTTSFTVTDRNSGTPYYYRVRAKNGTGASTYSNAITVTTSVAAPIIGAAASVTTSSFTANWGSVSGATAYYLDVSSNVNFASFVDPFHNYSTNLLSTNISGLNANTTYYYRVRGTTAPDYNPSDYSATQTVTTTPIPDTPNAYSATNITATSFTANWGIVPDAAEYYFDVSTSNIFETTLTGYKDLPVTGNSRNVTGLTLNTVYYYRVRAHNVTGVSGYSNVITVTADNNSNYNYISNINVLSPGKKDNLFINGLPVEEKNIETTFFDGLGRPMEIVSWQVSPLKKDLIQPIIYDQFGREAKKLLPYVDSDNDGTYRSNESLLGNQELYQTSDQFKFYQTGNPNHPDAIATDVNPYSISVLESSPLNRILNQGAPGLDFQPGIDQNVGHTIKLDYETNSLNEVRLLEVDNVSGSCINSDNSFYSPNQLYKTITKDENWLLVDGNLHTTEEFKDKSGQTVLKRSYVETESVMPVETYYVYDDFGLLRYVIPPKAASVIIFPVNKNDATIRSLCYCYEYDSRKRMVMKQLPGAEPVYMVYDKWDRLVLSQDGRQRLNNQWVFTKYDCLSRPIMTGIVAITDCLTQELVQNKVDTYYATYTLESNRFETTDASVYGYTITSSFPNTVTEADLLTITYYDKYTFNGAQSFLPALGIIGNNQGVIGKVTGGKIRILGNNTAWLTNTIYYDNKYRVIQSIKANHLASGTDVVTYKTDFSGKIIQSYSVHSHTGITPVSTTRTFDYDHAGRLIKIWHAVGAGTPVLMSYMQYNELGQLVDKKIHSTDTGIKFLQSIDYRYNIRGWLTHINNPDLGGTPTSDDPVNEKADAFGMEIRYNLPF